MSLLAARYHRCAKLCSQYYSREIVVSLSSEDGNQKMSRKDSIRRTLGSSGIKATVPPKPAPQPHKAAWARTTNAGRKAQGTLGRATPPVLLPLKKSEEIVHDSTTYNNYKKNKLSLLLGVVLPWLLKIIAKL